jgi:hypothetical protein
MHKNVLATYNQNGYPQTSESEKLLPKPKGGIPELNFE